MLQSSSVDSISRQIRGANLAYKLTCRLYYMRYYKSDNTAKLTIL